MNVLTPGATWLVMHRDVSDTVTVADAPAVHVALVLDPASGAALGTVPGQKREDALHDALAVAATRPMDGRRPSPPGRVVCAPDLAGPVAAELAALGLDAPVDKVVLADEAEDVFDSLVAALSGRRTPADWPEPEDWRRLYAQASRFLERRPWERWDDRVTFRLELEVGRSRTELAGVVLGAAGEQRRLALYPGPEVPAAALAGLQAPESVPRGTLTMFLDEEGVPPDLAAKARRYGWPAEADFLPTFFAWTEQTEPGSATELDASTARVLTVALAAVLDHDERSPRPGGADAGETRGELPLAGGAQGRYRLTAEPSRRPPAALPRDRTVIVGGEVRDDLLPDGSMLTVAIIPWSELDTARRRARRHQPAPATGKQAGEGLPVVIIRAPSRSGGELASRIAEAMPLGVAIIEEGPEALLLLFTRAGVFALGTADRTDEGLARFRRRVRANGGHHGVVVVRKALSSSGPMYGLFEMQLDTGPPTRLESGASRRKGRPKRRSR